MRALKEQLENLKPLLKRADFVIMNKKADKRGAHGVVLQAMPNTLGHIRVGFTVTKATEKSAVRRNRIKRRLRAVAAEVLPLYAKESCDYVLIGRPQTRTRPYETLCGDLRWCLEKTGYAKKS